MRPAYSVILLTTLIGAAQGLFLALFGADLAGRLALGPRPEAAFLATGSAVAIALLVAGVIASVFHLGRPERGWRAFSRWRTSWLSRELIVLPAFGATAFAWGAAHVLRIEPPLALGIAASLLALALYLCTGMIYACLPFLREWNSPLTVLNYLVLGIASGTTLAAALAAAFAPAFAPGFAGWAIAFTAAGLASRGASLLRNAGLAPRSTPASAIGVDHPRVTQVTRGFTARAFNTHEFFHGRPASVVGTVKWAFLALAFVAPLAVLAAALPSPSVGAATLAVALQMAGLMAERWHFFADASHPQNLYYRAVA